MSKIIPADRNKQIEVVNSSGAVDDVQLVDVWLTSRGFAQSTVRAYVPVVRGFLDHLTLRHKTLRTCTVADVASWNSMLTGAPATTRQKLAVVKSLLTFGAETGYLRYNVGKAIKADRHPRDLAERVLTEEEVYALFASATPRTEQLMRLLYYSAMRISEACSLQWSGVRKDDDGSVTLTVAGKGSKLRYVRMIKEHAERCLDERAADENYVLETRTGNPLHPGEAANMIRRAAVAAGLAEWKADASGRPTKALEGKRVSPHWFRHSHATHAIRRGAPIHLVQATLGHSSLAITGQYLHANPSESSGQYLGGS